MQVEDADENLSTGDESDNEDLTERSESDWPDYGVLLLETKEYIC